MKKTLLFLSFLLLLSCNKEIVNNENAPSKNGNSFKVEKEDIEKVVHDFLSEPINTRPDSPVCKIVAIDSMKTNYSTTRTGTEVNFPQNQNLLYFVKLSDGATIVVAGDKRAEPVYAHFNNLDLKFNNGKLMEQDKIPESFLFMLGAIAASILDEIDTETAINEHWNLQKTKSSESEGFIQPSKCTVIWGQGYPLNLKSPTSNGKFNDRGRAVAGCVTIAVAQALTVLRNEFTVFKGYELKTSWSRLKIKKSHKLFIDKNEIEDISNIIKRIAENIGISYDKEGSASTNTKKGINFLSEYLGGMFSNDQNWGNIENNMKGNPKGISFLSGNQKSDGWLWNVLGIKMPKLSGHAMLLDGFRKKNGKTLFHVNFGWYGTGNGYYLYNNKTWKEDAERKYSLWMEVYNFHIDTDYDDF